MDYLRRFPFGLLVLLLAAFTAAAQNDPSCPEIVELALQTTTNACAETGRNQACYGNLTLEAQLQTDTADFKFDTTGDRVDIAAIQSVRLSSLSLTDHTWGVALMKIQAKLPDTLPGQNVTLLMFGNVAIDNAVEPLTTLSMTASQNANVRARPTTEGSILASLSRGADVTANGRLEDGSWIRIQLPDDSHSVGWVSAQLLQSDGDVNTLLAVEASAQVYGPMQSFYFTSRTGDAACAEAPDSGILIQSPGAGKVNLVVNGAELTLGSTVYLQAQADGYMTVSVVEGNVVVAVNSVRQAVPAGTFTRIPLDTNGVVAGAPEFPQPYDPSGLAALPIQVLPETISIAPALSVADVQNAVAAVEGLPTPGNWRYATGAASNCNVQYPGAFTTRVAVEADGAVIVLGPDTAQPYRYSRTAPGTYILNGLPIDYTKVGSVNIRESETLTVLSATEMRIDATDLIPASNCRLSVSSTLTYIGS